MSNPTYRERTDRFRQLRNSFTNAKYIRSTEPSKVDTSLLPNAPTTSDIRVAMPVTPPWMQSVEQIDSKSRQIEQQINVLKHDHSSRQRVIFDDHKADKYDLSIQETTKSVTALFKATKAMLQSMTIKSNEHSIPLIERTTRYNAMCSRATKVQQLTKVFRDAQRHFLQQMQIKQERSNKYIDMESVTNTLPDLSGIYDESFNKEQMQRIQQMEMDASQKTQQILNIAKSVHALAELFNDLSQLVVEQGSLVDRIDYNVEQTLQTLHNTVPIVRKTNQYHKRSKTTLCIIVLVLLIILLGSIVILRHV
eukprot:152668_1